MRSLDEVSYEHPSETGKPAPMEFDILDLLLILAACKRQTFLITVAGMVIAVALAMIVHPTFAAKTMLIPSAQEIE